MSLSVHIQKKLGSFTLRADFDAENVTTALLGASGSGKSVTLKCIAGIMTPDCGSIVLDGRVLFDSEKRINLPPQQRRIGYLFQQYALFPNMTVEQNICCGIRSGKREEKRQKTADAVKRFRLEGLEKKYPVQLSGGQQQRVALSRILLSEPDAILLDEPFSALDSFLKWDLELELSDLLRDFHGPILWVSHDLGECFRNCHSVCVMENGVSGTVTTMGDLLHRPATQGAARLIGCHNFLPAHKCGSGVKIDGWDIVLPLSSEAEQVTLAIPDGAVSLKNGTTAARVKQIIRDVDGNILLLEPTNAQEAPLLRVKAAEDTPFAQGAAVNFNIDADKCLCYL